MFSFEGSLSSPLLSSSRQNSQEAAQGPVWKKLWEGAKRRLNPEKPRLPKRGEISKYLGLIPDFLYFINPNKAPRSIFVPFQHLGTTRRNGLKMPLSLFHSAVSNSVYGRDIHDGNRCPWMSRAAAAEAGMEQRRSWDKPRHNQGTGTQIPGRQNPARPLADLPEEVGSRGAAELPPLPDRRMGLVPIISPALPELPLPPSTRTRAAPATCTLASESPSRWLSSSRMNASG